MAYLSGHVVGWFCINSDLSTSVTAGNSIPMKGIVAIVFNEDVEITLNNMTTAFKLPASVPLSIGKNSDSISVNINTFMFAMDR